MKNRWKTLWRGMETVLLSVLTVGVVFTGGYLFGRGILCPIWLPKLMLMTGGVLIAAVGVLNVYLVGGKEETR